MNLTKELELATTLAYEAGAIAVSFKDKFTVTHKPLGEGPVTEADLLIDQEIVTAIKTAYPSDQVISEESYAGESITENRCWFIDPIDGTASYTQGLDDYSVMIGLAIGGQATLGVIFQPEMGILWRGVFSPQGCLAERIINKNVVPLVFPHKIITQNPRIVVSRTSRSARLQTLIDQIKPPSIVRRGSVGLKAMTVVDDEADIYFAWSTRIKLWDTCAAAAIVSASGGTMCDLPGQPLTYTGAINHNRPFVVANFALGQNIRDLLHDIAHPSEKNQ